MNIKKLSVVLSTFIFLLFSCRQQENNQTFECPYQQLDGNIINNKTNIEVLYNFTAGGNGKLNTNQILKKLGELDIGGELKGEFKNLHKQLTNSSIEYDKEFTQNWNVLVADICGQLNLLTSSSLSPAAKLKIEEKLIPKITSFSELVQKMGKQSGVQNIDNFNCETKVEGTKKSIRKVINEIKLNTPSEISIRNLTANRENIRKILLSVEENSCISVNSITLELDDLISLYSRIIEDNLILWESEAKITNIEQLTSYSKKLVEKIKIACKTLEVICNFYSCSDELNLVIKNSKTEINNY